MPACPVPITDRQVPAPRTPRAMARAVLVAAALSLGCGGPPSGLEPACEQPVDRIEVPQPPSPAPSPRGDAPPGGMPSIPGEVVERICRSELNPPPRTDRPTGTGGIDTLRTP